jgi:hypothetical protein
MRRFKTHRQARPIKIQGGEEVYTRLSKREYELRRDHFNAGDYNKPDHLADYDYND